MIKALKEEFMMKKIIIVISLLMFLLATAGCGSSNKYTLKKFNQIQTGMSYSQCAEIMGGSGTLSAESIMQGVPGVMPTTVIKSYSWQNPDGSNLSIMFENDRMNMKAQAGLN